MMIFRILPLVLTLAAMAGAAGAQVNDRFDGAWEGILRDASGNCSKFSPVPVTARIDGGRVSVASTDGRTATLSGRVDADGEVELTGRKGGSAGWGAGVGDLRISGRIRTSGFKGTGKSGGCRAALVLKRTQVAAGAGSDTVAAASPPPVPAPPTPTPPAPATARGGTKTQAVGPFDGTWEGTLKVVVGGCGEFDMVPLTVAIDGGAIIATSKVDGSIIARGEVNEFGEAALGGSKRGKAVYQAGTRHLRISGRFRGDGFKGTGKILRQYNNCQARLTLNRTQMAATVKAPMAATSVTI